MVLRRTRSQLAGLSTVLSLAVVPACRQEAADPLSGAISVSTRALSVVLMPAEKKLIEVEVDNSSGTEVSIGVSREGPCGCVTVLKHEVRIPAHGRGVVPFEATGVGGERESGLRLRWGDGGTRNEARVGVTILTVPKGPRMFPAVFMVSSRQAGSVVARGVLEFTTTGSSPPVPQVRSAPRGVEVLLNAPELLHSHYEDARLVSCWSWPFELVQAGSRLGEGVTSDPYSCAWLEMLVDGYAEVPKAMVLIACE